MLDAIVITWETEVVAKGARKKLFGAKGDPGFPASWKIMENLENEKCIFQTWKNHGIWKKKAKIMEKSPSLPCRS